MGVSTCHLFVLVDRWAVSEPLCFEYNYQALKHMQKVFFSLMSFFLGACLLAQTAEDALRYSYLSPTGTARFAGTAGAMTPLGVDFTTLSTNPAGIGWVRKGYVVFSPGFKLENTGATLQNGQNNSEQTTNRSRLTLPNIGVVFPGSTRSLYWSTFSIGLGINRLADFNETISFRGNSAGSILDAFVEDANDGIFNDFRNNLALEADAILQDAQGYFSDFDSNPAGVVSRNGQIVRTGGMSEFVLGFGGNYRERLMWGFTLGIPFMKYRELRNYTEIDSDGVIDYFDDLSFEELLETDGTGVNFKLGLLLRPTQAIRLSLAVHSPTFWSMDEVYETTFTYAYTDIDTNEALGGTALSPRGEFNYNLQTPWRLLGGLGTVIGKKGFLALDVDYVNYAANKFSYDDFTTEAEAVNEEVKVLLKSALTTRLGGELNLAPFQVRAGVGLQSYPVVGSSAQDLLFGLGAGYRKERFFVDIAYQNLARNRNFQPYGTFSVEPQDVQVTNNRHQLIISGGISF